MNSNSEVNNNGSIYVLHYNGIITGSLELRNYNAQVVSTMYGDKEDLTEGTPMHYYNQYDNASGGKKNEPFFDAFLVHLAMLDLENTEQFCSEITGDLEDIKYYKTEIKDSPDSNIRGKSSLKSNISLDTITRAEMQYKSAKHIFIMSPMTELMSSEIQSVCEERTSNGQNVIIHIQGDAIKNEYESGDNHPAKSQNNGLTGKSGMFPDAFNLFSGGLAVQGLRSYLQSNPNANILSVSPVTGTAWKPARKPVPDYYKNVNRDVLTVSQNPNSGFGKKLGCFISEGLDIHKVYQDGTDKDNLASLILLGRLNRDRSIPTDFIGFRLYKSSTVPFGVDSLEPTGQQKNYMTGAAAGFPGGPFPFAKPTTFNFASQRNNPEYSKPADSRGDKFGNLPFDAAQADLTRRFYANQRAGFQAVLKPYAGNIIINNNGVDQFIVDGLGLVSESERAPFNMSLFYFAPNTYQSSALIEATSAADYNSAMLAIKGVESARQSTEYALSLGNKGAYAQYARRGGRRRKNRKKTKKKKKRKSKKGARKKKRKTKKNRRKTKKRRRR